VAALVWSLFPSKSAAEIRAALAYSAEDLSVAGWDVDTGYGLVRADLAVEYLQDSSGPIDPVDPDPVDPIPEPDQCTDQPNWADSAGDGCDWYNTADRCIVFGDGFAGVDGLVANEACCSCGGGTTEEECVDDDWVDSFGDGCEWYEFEDYCSLFGNDFVNDGKTASTACCACQGVTVTSVASAADKNEGVPPTPRQGGGTVAFQDIDYEDFEPSRDSPPEATDMPDKDAARGTLSMCLSVLIVVFASVILA